MISQKNRTISETPKNTHQSPNGGRANVWAHDSPHAYYQPRKSTTGGSTSIRFGHVASPEGDWAPVISPGFGGNRGQSPCLRNGPFLANRS